MSGSLSSYKKKRRFDKTSEPKAVKKASKHKNIFVVQKHFASRLHFDVRLEMNRVLKSWAVPKQPSKDTKVKRLAILTEDHPMDYAKFEGEIPKGQYGGGKVEIWDSGTYENIKMDKKGKVVPMSKCFKNGQIEIVFYGKKLKGSYAFIHFKEKNWLLIKMREKNR